MNGKPLISPRVSCPCCGYPTLSESAAFEVCELCSWEDDGQGEAGEVWGGPNSDCSLIEARENFRRFRVMYAPGRDQRITAGDSPLQYKTKDFLVEAFERLKLASGSGLHEIETRIFELEQVLSDERRRIVREYETRQRGKA